MWTRVGPPKQQLQAEGTVGGDRADKARAQTRPARQTSDKRSALGAGRGEETASIFNKDPEVNLYKNISYFLLSVHLFLACCRPALRMSLGQVIIPKGPVLLGEGGWPSGPAKEGAGEAPALRLEVKEVCARLRRGDPEPLGKRVGVAVCSLIFVIQDRGVKTPLPH